MSQRDRGTGADAPWREDDEGNVLCDICDQPITAGKTVMAGGDERNLYLHERCVQP